MFHKFTPYVREVKTYTGAERRFGVPAVSHSKAETGDSPSLIWHVLVNENQFK